MKFTEYLAIYGAMLSTFVFLWNYVRSRPKIKVELVYGSGVSDNESNQVIGVYISVQNISNHTIHLSNISLLAPDNSPSLKDRITNIIRYKRHSKIGWVTFFLSRYGISDGCPMSLEGRKSHDIFIPMYVIDEILNESPHRKIRAVVQDELWNDTYSRQFKLDLKDD